MQKSLLIAFSILGSVIGLGMASGKELIMIFSTNNKISILIPFVIAFMFFAITFLYLRASTSIDIDVDRKLYGKYYKIPKIFMSLNSLIVLSTMLAGIDNVYNNLANLSPLYSILTALLVVFVITNGIYGIFSINVFFVPIIGIAILIVGILSTNSNSFFFEMNPKVFKSFNYVSYNILLAISLLKNIKKISKKQILQTSIFTGIFIFGFCMFLTLAINSNEIIGDIPILNIANSLSPLLHFVIITILTFSIVTTMAAALNNLTDDFCKSDDFRTFYALSIVFVAFVISRIGFSHILKYVYPFMSLFSMIYTIKIIFYCLNKDKLWKGSVKDFIEKINK